MFGAATFLLGRPKSSTSNTAAPADNEATTITTDIPMYSPPLEVVSEPSVVPTTIATPRALISPYPYPAPTIDLSRAVPPSIAPRPEDPYRASACGLRETDINFVVRTSSVIVRGTVKEVPPPRWSTPDGKRPPNPHDPQGTGNLMYRPVVVEVQQYLKGEQPQRTLVLLARGGTIRQDTQDYCGDPIYTFQNGEQVVLFLYPPEEGLGPIPPAARGGSPVWAISEHYIIADDGQAFNIAHRVPVQQLLDEIRAALAAPSLPTPPPLPTAAP
jgi:hypothetical protein